MAEKKERGGGFILIVEDDKGTSELEAQRLEPLGIEIRRAASAEETEGILKKNSPHLMLLDYSLPGSNAIQLVKYLRDHSIDVPPFIVVTGRGDEAVAVEAMKAGAQDYIIKNAEFLENLLPAARKVLDKIVLMRDLAEARRQVEVEKEKYKDLFSLAPLPYLIFDAEGRIMEKNKSSEALSGYAMDESVGHSSEEFIFKEDRGKFIGTIKKALDSGKLEKLEFRLPSKDGALKTVEASFLAAETSTGEKRVQCACTDITERKAAEENVKKSLHLYNFLAQVNLAASQTKDRERLFQQICQIAVQTGGMRMAWIGRHDPDLGRILPFCSAGVVNGYLDTIKIALGGANSAGPTGTAASTGNICTSTDIAADPGMAPWREKALALGYRSSSAIPLEEGGKLTAVLTIYSEQALFFTSEELKLLNEIKADISLALNSISTEEKRASAQAALEQTAAQLAHVMDVTPVILFTLKEKAGRVLTDWVSGNAQVMTGYAPEEMLTPDWWVTNMHPEDRARVVQEQKDIFKKDRIVQDFRFRRKDGRYFWVHSQLNVYPGKRDEISGSWTDITQLKESEARFQELFEKAPIGYQSLDENARLLAVNDTWLEIFGYTREEAIGRTWSEFLAPGYERTFQENFTRIKAAGSISGLEYEIQRKDGTRRRISLSARIAHNPDGSFRQTHGIFTDISATWKAERQREMLNEAIKASFNEVYVFDPATFKFIFVNQCALKNLGYSEEEMERLTPWDLKKEFTEASFRKAIEPLLQKSKTTLIFESRHTRKDGTSYPVEVRLQFIETAEAPIFLAVINDITERRKSERMLHEMASMQRVESLGALAGGIAHDFNNMLTGIMANLSLLGSRNNCDPASQEIINDTIEAARNAQGLTSQLLAFSKGGRPVKKEFCMETALREIFKLSTSGTKAACEVNVPENLWSVEGDENQIKQAVNNLLINAIQAMPSGGHLRLEAGNVRCEGLPAFAGGDCVKITVSDTGIGIPPKYLDRIFEPYFTTKNQGHGLGLSMTWSVVKNHGGHIEAISEPGKGTTFEIYLPATGRCLLEKKAELTEIHKGSGRILVLEDEEVVSKAVVRMLGELGYTCEITSDGKDTLRVYQEAEKAGRPFSAVIMDLTIPGGMGGKEAVQELRKTAPAVPAIVSSGYSDEAVMADYKKYGFDAVLPKPYKYEELAETLTRLLKK